MVFFENALAINDLSLEVREGELVGVIGSNSAGKTTLMNSLSGLIIDMRIKEKRRGGERINLYGKINVPWCVYYIYFVFYILVIPISSSSS